LFLFSPLQKNPLPVEYMIDFIQVVMVIVIYHFEIDLVQVKKTVQKKQIQKNNKYYLRSFNR
jgi:hypothetical protein